MLWFMTTMRPHARAILYDVGVNNRPTPKGMLVTVAFLALYCAVAIWFGWTRRVWVMDAVGLVATVACVGTATMLRWSRFLVYVLSIAFAATWLFSIYAAARVGYYTPLPWLTIIVSLIPGAVLLAVAGFCSRMAHRYLGKPQALPTPAAAV